MIKKGKTLTKCCGVCYSKDDINSIVDFCLSKGLRYYFIRHSGFNDEVKDDSHKEHWHFIIESDSQHRFIINSLISDSLKENLFQSCENVHSYLRYMTHIDYLDKEHYPITDITTNIDFDLLNSYINDIVVDKVLQSKENFNLICDLICANDEELSSFRGVLKFCRLHNIEYKTSWTTTIINLLKGY